MSTTSPNSSRCSDPRPGLCDTGGIWPASVANAVLPRLAQPDRYQPCSLDLSIQDELRGYWLNLFRNHFPSLLDEAVREGVDRGLQIDDIQTRCEEAGRLFTGYLDAIESDPKTLGRLDILTICLERERILRSFGIEDPYRLTKAKENQAALDLLPALLAELDHIARDEPGQLPRRLVDGIFAGNIFDLGVQATLKLFQSGGVDFHAVRSKLKPRPWVVDDLDPWVERWLQGRPYHWAVLFVDNAGCDVVLGMLPMARALLKRGTGVILTANSMPSLNDITHRELVPLVESVAQWDTVIGDGLADGRLELIPSGNGAPLIDLSRLTPGLVEAVERRGVDLVVLEGMGRSLESNLETRFTCDVVKVAMIKDMGVATAIGAKLYDLFFQFEQASRD